MGTLAGLSALVFLYIITLRAQNSEIQARPPLRINGVPQNSIVGLTPGQIRHQYGFDQISNVGAGQTIAIVDAYEHPFIESDLAIFNQAFGLPACTTSNGCFRKIYASQHPGVDTLWDLEIALDVEWAHAIAPAAKLILVEAKTAHLTDLVQAVDVAVQNGASVVSMSWGTPEFNGETAFDNHFVASNVTFVAASGDFGNPAFYPAASPFVTAVGGTTLNSTTANYAGEVAWSGSGGGLSPYETEPHYQAVFKIPNDPNGRRGLPDVAYNGDPTTGNAIYTSMPYQGAKGWLQIAGTSVGAPQWSALFAIVNSLRVAAGRPLLSGANASLYDSASTAKSYAANYHDILSGSNGTCGTTCNTSSGYDYVTGIGSPQANNLINALSKVH
jgi:subtilase family serine protease